MEAPLNAREFIKRFHLPQLVRVSSLGETRENKANLTTCACAGPTLNCSASPAEEQACSVGSQWRPDIKLAPPSERPKLSKLQLDQPFLLYKAHRKLEVRAYALDAKNELEETSGDAIYLPHNYPGE